MRIDTLAIVGVGLMGGSLGLAARRRGLARRVLGVGRQPSSLARAAELGIVDEYCLDPREAASQANVVVFCTPVDVIAAQVLAVAPHCAAGTLLTDAGSTKAEIVQAVEGRLPSGIAFVGSHPLAGSEKRGPEYADADLFVDRLTVVTPTVHTDPNAVEQTAALWRAVGSEVCLLSPAEHDQALALTSHLPHLLASALAGILPPQLHMLTATGFRDTTRVAAGDPALWAAIFLQNRREMIDAVGRLQERVSDFKHALLAGDREALEALLTEAKRTRDALGN